MSKALRPHAIVVPLDCITGLQTARILASHGVPVIGIALDRKHACCRTSSVERVIESDTRGPALVSSLRALAAELPEKAVLFPCGDPSVMTLSDEREALEDRFHVMLAEADTVDLLALKSRFYRRAEEAGWATPETHFLSKRADAERLARELEFPRVLKPPLKNPGWTAEAGGKVVKLEDGRALLDFYDRCAPHVDELILQEWIPGGDQDMFACYAYHDAASRPVWTVVARKLRQWPLETGSGSLAVTVDCPEVVEKTLQVLHEARYRGLSFLQFKRDPRSGTHYIIEANVGRTGLGMPICEASGVDILYTQFCEALGLPRPERRPPGTGAVKWICWRRDLAAAHQQWRRGELTLGAWWRSLRGRKRCAIFSWRDPGPFVADVFEQLAGLARALVSGSRRQKRPASPARAVAVRTAARREHS